MARNIDLFKISISGIDEINRQFTALESRTKSINTVLKENNDLFTGFDTQLNTLASGLGTYNQQIAKIVEDLAKASQYSVEIIGENANKSATEVDNLSKSEKELSISVKENNETTKQSVSIVNTLREAYISASNELDGQREQYVILRHGLSATQSEIKNLEKSFATNLITSKEYVKQKAQLIAKEAEQKNALKDLDSAIKNNQNIISTSIGSINNLSAVQSRLRQTISGLSEAETYNGKTKKELQATAEALSLSLQKENLAMGRNKSGFDSLGFSVQQVARELPSLTISAQQFFLAISNNIPILVDNINRTKAANAALKAEGQATVSVGRQLLGSIASFNTLLVVGVTLLTAYAPELQKMWNKLGNVNSEMKNLNEVQLKSATQSADLILKYEKLRLEYNKLGNSLKEQKKYITENKNEFKDLGFKINDVNDAERFFVKDTKKVTDALMDRAKAAAAYSLAQDQMKKLIELEIKRDQRLKEAPTVLDKITGALGTAVSGMIDPNDYIKMSGADVKNSSIGLINREIEEQKKSVMELLNLSNTFKSSYENVLDYSNSKSSTKESPLESLIEREKNAAERRAEQIRENNQFIEKLLEDTDRIITESQVDSIEKRIQKQKKSDDKELLQLDQSIADKKAKIESSVKDINESITKIDTAIKANPKDTKLVESLKQQKNELFAQSKDLQQQLIDLDRYGNKQSLAILDRATFEKLEILKNYTVDELNQYRVRFLASKDFNDKDLKYLDEIIKNKIAKQKDKVNNEIELERSKFEQNYQTEKEIINATISDNKTKNKELAKLEIDHAQNKYALLKKELEIRRANGMLTAQDLENYKKQLKEILAEIDLLSQKGKRTTPLAQMLGIDDEQAEVLKEKAFEIANQINDTIASIQLERNQKWLENEQKRIDEVKNREMKSLDSMNKKGIMSEESYNRRKEEIEKRAQEQKDTANKEAFEKEKDIKTKQALMEMALGIVKIWAQSGINIVMGSILTGALVASTAINVAQIQAQQFATGGKVQKLPNGRINVPQNIQALSNGDNILATVRSGEVILNKAQQNMLGGESTFRAIGVPGFSTGGRLSSLFETYQSVPIPQRYESIAAKKSITDNLSQTDFAAIIGNKVQESIKSVQFYVSETEISKVQGTVKGTVNQSTLL